MAKRAKGLKSKNYLLWVAVVSFFTLVFYVVSVNVRLYQANIAMKPKLLFDGTALPVREVPDWVNTPAQEWKLSYANINKTRLEPLPKYDPDKLSRSADSLEWGNSYHDLIRDMKITFSVPYMGNYKLDGGEHTGSHLAVDIKALTGTPVYAIANGIVVKASNQSSGFGNHVVIRHDEAPLPSGGKGTIYSSYSHLQGFQVEEGEDVKRGQLIGQVGDTGTATTPHLHFQIDKSSAPWHPYWPFTSREASDAGYSFFEAINNGLGRDKAIENTINPMEFVQDNLKDGELTDVEDIEENEPVVAADDSAEIGRVLFFHDRSYVEGEDVKIRIKLLDVDAEDITDPDFDGSIALSLRDDIGNLDKVLLKDSDFNDGVAKILVRDTIPGTTRLIAEYDGETYSSELFTVLPKDLELLNEDAAVEEGVSIEVVASESEAVSGGEVGFKLSVEGELTEPVSVMLSDDLGELSADEIGVDEFEGGEAEVKVDNLGVGEFRLIATYGDKEFVSESVVVKPAPTRLAKFEIEHDGYFLEGVKEKIQVRALDKEEELIDDFVPVEPVLVSLVTGEGELSRDILVPGNFKNGVAEFGFTSSSEAPVRIEVVHGKVVAESQNLKAGLYADVGVDNDNYRAIKYLTEKKVVQGYEDGSFKPDAPIARVEVLKMILAALDYDLEHDGEVDFSDVELEAWYSPYLVTAVDTGIIDGYPDRTFRPANTVINAEFFKMLVMASGDELDDVTGKPYRDVDVDDWYAPHAEYVRSKRILDGSNLYFRADDVITRGEVADAIYRVLMIKKNGVRYYRSSLK